VPDLHTVIFTIQKNVKRHARCAEILDAARFSDYEYLYGNEVDRRDY